MAWLCCCCEAGQSYIVQACVHVSCSLQNMLKLKLSTGHQNALIQPVRQAPSLTAISDPVLSYGTQLQSLV